MKNDILTDRQRQILRYATPGETQGMERYCRQVLAYNHLDTFANDVFQEIAKLQADRHSTSLRGFFEAVEIRVERMQEFREHPGTEAVFLPPETIRGKVQEGTYPEGAMSGGAMPCDADDIKHREWTIASQRKAADDDRTLSEASSMTPPMTLKEIAKAAAARREADNESLVSVAIHEITEQMVEVSEIADGIYLRREPLDILAVQRMLEAISAITHHLRTLDRVEAEIASGNTYEAASVRRALEIGAEITRRATRKNRAADDAYLTRYDLDAIEKLSDELKQVLTVI